MAKFYSGLYVEQLYTFVSCNYLTVCAGIGVHGVGLTGVGLAGVDCIRVRVDTVVVMVITMDDNKRWCLSLLLERSEPQSTSMLEVIHENLSHCLGCL